MLIAFNKPFGVICKFRREPGRPTLGEFVDVPNVYPAGRLDTDSEGLLLLTDDGALQARIANPRHELAKVYWAQVEGAPTEAALAALRAGVDLGDFVTKPAGARLIDEPASLWSRDPPIRYRAKIPTAWLRGYAARRQEPPSAADDSTRRLPDVALGACGDRRGRARWAGTRAMARGRRGGAVVGALTRRPHLTRIPSRTAALHQP